MKKLLALALAIIMTAFCFVGCGKKEDGKVELNDVPVADIEAAIAELYGEEYVCNMDIPAEFLEENYGVKAEWVSEFVAKMPMISFHVDTFIAVKAAEGQADNVEKALTDYRDYVVENSINYPSNVPKVKATQVYRLGDYVFYLCLGQIDMMAFDEEYGAEAEAKAEEAAKANNQKAIDKIDELLKK